MSLIDHLSLSPSSPSSDPLETGIPLDRVRTRQLLGGWEVSNKTKTGAGNHSDRLAASVVMNGIEENGNLERI